MTEFGLASWLHQMSFFRDMEHVRAHADRLAAGGFDIFIPCVKDGHGAADFVTELADVSPGYPDFDPLKPLVDNCQARGVKVHTWFCVFTEGRRSRLLREHPEYIAKIEDPQEPHQWACACRPQVQDYLLALYEDVARRYRPAGLHLDYIRTGGACKCDYCREQMRGHGVDLGAVAPDEPAYQQWTQWRVGQVSSFVARLREFTQAEGLELSAAVYPDYPDCVAKQGQDWVDWAEKGLVDFLFPMNYTDSAEQARLRAADHVACVGGAVPVWEGLAQSLSRRTLSPEALMEQVTGVLGAGADGVVLFEYRGVGDEHIRAINSLRQARSDR